MQPSAKVISDSVAYFPDRLGVLQDGSPAVYGKRLTTMEVVMNRFVLAEFNTHRMFSRNSASSRAIPVKKQIEKVRNDIAYPRGWPAEQKGMQGGDLLPEFESDCARDVWDVAARNAIASAEVLVNLGVHKSVTNRLLEPFMWHTAVVTSSEWENFFTQRCSPLAQPELRATAEAMYTALLESTPTPLKVGEWHLPYTDSEDWKWAETRDIPSKAVHLLKMLSVARCARVSYLTQDGKRDPGLDVDMYARLIEAAPPHASPLEHVATPVEEFEYGLGNFRGWRQLRHEVLGF